MCRRIQRYLTIHVELRLADHFPVPKLWLNKKKIIAKIRYKGRLESITCDMSPWNRDLNVFRKL